MARLSSAARSMAAGNLTSADAPPDFANVGQESAEVGPPAPPAPSLEEGLSILEAALESLPPDKAERARSHVEALRQIATEDGGEPEQAPVTPELEGPGETAMGA